MEYIYIYIAVWDIGGYFQCLKQAKILVVPQTTKQPYLTKPCLLTLRIREWARKDDLKAYYFTINCLLRRS